MRAPITDKHLLEMMWERFPEIMKRGAEQPTPEDSSVVQPAPVQPAEWADAHGNYQWRGVISNAAMPTPVQQEPVTGCVCRWNSEGDRVVTCERHQGWLEVIAEWADRARDAEKKLKALNTSPPAQRKPLADEAIRDCWSSVQGVTGVSPKIHAFARAIEAAHGIKENK